MSPFSIEDDTMTPTMKIRRYVILMFDGFFRVHVDFVLIVYRQNAYLKHKAELDALYALGEPQHSAPIAKL